MNQEEEEKEKPRRPVVPLFNMAKEMIIKHINHVTEVGSIPDEIMNDIFTRLAPRQVARIERANRSRRFHNNQVWKKFCFDSFPAVEVRRKKDTGDMSWKSVYRKMRKWQREKSLNSNKKLRSLEAGNAVGSSTIEISLRDSQNSFDEYSLTDDCVIPEKKIRRFDDWNSQVGGCVDCEVLGATCACCGSKKFVPSEDQAFAVCSNCGVASSRPVYVFGYGQ